MIFFPGFLGLNSIGWITGKCALGFVYVLDVRHTHNDNDNKGYYGMEMKGMFTIHIKYSVGLTIEDGTLMIHVQYVHEHSQIHCQYQNNVFNHQPSSMVVGYPIYGSSFSYVLPERMTQTQSK